MLISIPRVITKKIAQYNKAKEKREWNWYTGKYSFNTKKDINWETEEQEGTKIENSKMVTKILPYQQIHEV